MYRFTTDPLRIDLLVEQIMISEIILFKPPNFLFIHDYRFAVGHVNVPPLRFELY